MIIYVFPILFNFNVKNMKRVMSPCVAQIYKYDNYAHADTRTSIHR